MKFEQNLSLKDFQSCLVIYWQNLYMDVVVDLSRSQKMYDVYQQGGYTTDNNLARIIVNAEAEEIQRRYELLQEALDL